MIDQPQAYRPVVSLKGLAGPIVLGTCLLWSYWTTFAIISREWATNPVYSHGFLVPIFALVLLGFRRQKFTGLALKPDWRGGCALLLVAGAFRLASAYYFVPWLDYVSLVPCLGGLCLLLAGQSYFAVAWPAIAFLMFMVPLPYRVETGLRQPLQGLATQASTYALQTLGCPAFAEGNVIILKDRTLGVAEACSGLSMLLVFFALATGVALIIRRPIWEKVLIFMSAVPIALLANVGRITLTGLLYQLGRGREAELIFHDLSGWLMMPAGLIMIGIELMILQRLVVAPEVRKPLPIIFSRPASGANHGRRDRNGKRRHPQRSR
jgi:exosortase